MLTGAKEISDPGPFHAPPQEKKKKNGSTLPPPEAASDTTRGLITVLLTLHLTKPESDIAFRGGGNLGE